MTFTKEKNNDLEGLPAFSWGFTLAASYPNNGYGFSFSKFKGSNTDGLIFTFMKGKGVSLDLSVNTAYYESLTNENVELEQMPGKGSQFDLGLGVLGGSVNSNGYYSSYGMSNPTYRSYDISAGIGLDAGTASWETKTVAVPILPWIGLLLP